MCTEMGMAGIPRNPRETRGDGDKVEKSCGNPVEMEVSLAGFPRGWKKHLTPSASDSLIISQLKHHLNKQLQQYFRIGPLHFIATLLDPRFKNNFLVVPPQQHAVAVESLKQMVDAVSRAEDISGA